MSGATDTPLVGRPAGPDDDLATLHEYNFVPIAWTEIAGVSPYFDIVGDAFDGAEFRLVRIIAGDQLATSISDVFCVPPERFDFVVQPDPAGFVLPAGRARC